MENVGIKIAPGNLFSKYLLRTGLIQPGQESARMNLAPSQMRAQSARSWYSGKVPGFVIIIKMAGLVSAPPRQRCRFPSLLEL